jgi:hypothetical protein
MTAAVGADIESLCSKCGDVWHVVVAKVGEKIAKVQCKQCSGFHRYKPPAAGAEKGAPMAGAGVKVKAVKSTTGTKKPSARARKGTAEPGLPSVAADLGRPVRGYGVAEAYTAGDRIQHASFGLGIVQGSPGPGKIDVAFTGGRRVLAQAKAESALSRPVPRAGDD